MANWRKVGKLIPFLVVQQPSTGLGPETAPLLEEERHVTKTALVANLADPFGVDGAGARAAFSADDNPMDVLKIKLPNWTYKGFKRKKADRGQCLLKMKQPR